MFFCTKLFAVTSSSTSDRQRFNTQRASVSHKQMFQQLKSIIKVIIFLLQNPGEPLHKLNRSIRNNCPFFNSLKIATSLERYALSVVSSKEPEATVFRRKLFLYSIVSDCVRNHIKPSVVITPSFQEREVTVPKLDCTNRSVCPFHYPAEDSYFRRVL